MSLDKDEAAIAQACLPDRLAHKIWRATPSDFSLNTEEAFKMPTGLGEAKESSSMSSSSSSDATTSYLNEVGRALHVDTKGQPENGSVNHFKAAENYALFGEDFLDFPKDLTSCYSGLLESGNTMPAAYADHPPPGFDRPARSAALYERRQGQASAGTSGCTNYGSPSTSAAAAGGTGGGAHHLQQQQHQQQQQQKQQQQQRQAAGAEAVSASRKPSNVQMNEMALYQKLFSQQPPQQQQLILQQLQQQQQQQQSQAPPPTAQGMNCPANANDITLAQLYQQVLARNFRSNQTAHLQQSSAQQQQQQQQTNSNAAAAAAMLYANMELQQQVQLRQFQLQQMHQQQQQQQQQQLPRPPRAIFGAGNGGAASSAGKEPPSPSSKK